jgi:hypothetical protein
MGQFTPPRSSLKGQGIHNHFTLVTNFHSDSPKNMMQKVVKLTRRAYHLVSSNRSISNITYFSDADLHTTAPACQKGNNDR